MANLTADQVIKEAMAQLTALQKREAKLNADLDEIEELKKPVRENLGAAIDEAPLPHQDVFNEWVDRPKRGRKPATETANAEAKPKN